MLSLARVLVRDPKLLITDELSLGLAPVIIDEVYRTLATIRDAGTSLLIVEQHVHQALTLADDVVVMAKGRVALSGPADDLGDISERILPAVHGETRVGQRRAVAPVADANGPPPRAARRDASVLRSGGYSVTPSRPTEV